VASTIPAPGKSLYTYHKDCERGRADYKKRLWVTSDGTFIRGLCHNCGKKYYKRISRNDSVITPIALAKVNPTIFPNDYSDLPLKNRLFLYQYGIEDNAIELYRIGYSPRLQRVVLPIYQGKVPIFWQLRATKPEQQPKYITSRGRRKPLTILNPGARALVLVEDWLSCIKLQLSCTTISICCLFGTSLSADKALQIKAQYNKIILWLDGDKAGREGTKKLHKALGAPINYVGSIRTEADPKTYNKKQINTMIGTHNDKE